MPPSSSSWPKPFSSTTREDRASPTSPKSLVRTLFRAFSEKEAMFFWAAAPYWSTTLESVTSIFWANSSTIFRSASVSMDSSSFTALASRCFCRSSSERTGSPCTGAASWAAAPGSRVRAGASGAAGAAAAAASASGVRVRCGVISRLSLMVVFLLNILI